MVSTIRFFCAFVALRHICQLPYAYFTRLTVGSSQLIYTSLWKTLWILWKTYGESITFLC